MALTGLFNTTLLVLLSVIFAWKGCAAASILLPRPIINLVRLTVFWSLTRPTLACAPVPPVEVCVSRQRDAHALPHRHDHCRSGGLSHPRLRSRQGGGRHLFFAFNLSMQAMRVLGYNLDSVLFPALAGFPAIGSDSGKDSSELPNFLQ